MARSRSRNIDHADVDAVLTTTRAVRRRLDFSRPADNDVLLECIDIAEQAPTGANLASRRWIIVRDQTVKDALAEHYCPQYGFSSGVAAAIGPGAEAAVQTAANSGVDCAFTSARWASPPLSQRALTAIVARCPGN